MTEISTIYEGYVTAIEAALSGYCRIANPYDPEENANLMLRKGYGIGFGPAQNTDRFIDCRLSLVREFFVVLVQQVALRDNDGEARAVIEKQLFEDQLAIIQAFEADPTLNGAGRPGAKFISDGGIEFLQADKAKYLLIEMQFESEYFEALE